MRAAIALVLFSAIAWAAAPDGRYDGTIEFGKLKIPFRLDFEGGVASLVNGDVKTRATSANVKDGVVELQFGAASIQAKHDPPAIEGTLEFSGTKYKFTAMPFCSCGYEGEAGPDISGVWETPNLHLSISRHGEDTYASVTRGGEQIGPMVGRFDGLSFTLRYFDGKRAALMEIELTKDKSLDVAWRQPGLAEQKFKATRHP